MLFFSSKSNKKPPSESLSSRQLSHIEVFDEWLKLKNKDVLAREASSRGVFNDGENLNKTEVLDEWLKLKNKNALDSERTRSLVNNDEANLSKQSVREENSIKMHTIDIEESSSSDNDETNMSKPITKTETSIKENPPEIDETRSSVNDEAILSKKGPKAETWSEQNAFGIEETRSSVNDEEVTLRKPSPKDEKVIESKRRLHATSDNMVKGQRKASPKKTRCGTSKALPFNCHKLVSPKKSSKRKFSASRKEDVSPTKTKHIPVNRQPPKTVSIPADSMKKLVYEGTQVASPFTRRSSGRGKSLATTSSHKKVPPKKTMEASTRSLSPNMEDVNPTTTKQIAVKRQSFKIVSTEENNTIPAAAAEKVAAEGVPTALPMKRRSSEAAKSFATSIHKKMSPEETTMEAFTKKFFAGMEDVKPTKTKQMIPVKRQQSSRTASTKQNNTIPAVSAESVQHESMKTASPSRRRSRGTAKSLATSSHKKVSPKKTFETSSKKFSITNMELVNPTKTKQVPFNKQRSKNVSTNKNHTISAVSVKKGNRQGKKPASPRAKTKCSGTAKSLSASSHKKGPQRRP